MQIAGVDAEKVHQHREAHVQAGDRAGNAWQRVDHPRPRRCRQQPYERESAPASVEVDVASAARELREAQRKRFRDRLRYHDGNLTRTAEMYGVSRTTGWRMMKRLDVERDEPAPTDPRRGKKQPAG